MEINRQNYTFSELFKFPNYAGCYKLSGLSIYLEKKPKWFHRTMMKLCLGWEWVDEVKN